MEKAVAESLFWDGLLLSFPTIFINHFYFETKIPSNDVSFGRLWRRKLYEEAGDYTLTLKEKNGKTETIQEVRLICNTKNGKVSKK